MASENRIMDIDSEIIQSNNMMIYTLRKLSTEQLIVLLLKKENKRISKSRISVRKYDDDIIEPPTQFRDEILSPPPQFRDEIPKTKITRKLKKSSVKVEKTKRIPPPMASKIRIVETGVALENFVKSYSIDIKHDKDPLKQLNETKGQILKHIRNVLSNKTGIKLVEILKITFKKPKGEDIEFKTAFFGSKASIIMNETEIKQSLILVIEQIIEGIGRWLSEGSGWSIESADRHYLNFAKYLPLKGSSYIQLPKELKNHVKGLGNMKNKDNECFRWCHIRHLNPHVQDKDPQRIKQVDKTFVNQLDYSGIEFPVEVKHYNRIEKQNEIRINVFSYENKQPFPIFLSKEKFDDELNLLLITENENKHYVLIKDFNRFMYNKTKQEHKNHFCMNCLQCFSSGEILNKH